MNYYFDTEFVELTEKPSFKIGSFKLNLGQPITTIELISIGMVDSTGRPYYALNKDLIVENAWNNSWVRQNVLLPIWQSKLSGDQKNTFDFTLATMKWIFKTYGRTLKEIANDLEIFILSNDNQVEIYHYYGAYDWVLFCQIFGGMLNLPGCFPMCPYDLKQIMNMYGLTKEWKREHAPDPDGEHNALTDAMWNKILHETILSKVPEMPKYAK